MTCSCWLCKPGGLPIGHDGTMPPRCPNDGRSLTIVVEKVNGRGCIVALECPDCDHYAKLKEAVPLA